MNKEKKDQWDQPSMQSVDPTACIGIMSTVTGDVVAWVCGRDENERMERAKLTAAAPRMLFALQTLVSKYDADPTGVLSFGMTAEDFQSARDAIKYATGE